MKIGFSSLALAALLLMGCAPSSQTRAAEGSEQHGNETIISSSEQFDQSVAEGFVLVDFWATWCPPCKIMNPIIAEIAEEQSGSLRVLKVDVDENNELASRYNIEAIPTFMLFKDGKVVDRKVGAFSKERALNWINSHKG